MRGIVNSLLRFALVLLFAFQLLAARAQVGDLQINLIGIEKEVGTLHVALYDTKSSFLDTSQYFRSQHIAVKNQNTLTFTFENLPSGRYAVALFIDKNRNKKLDTNFLGIPKEKYGFSGKKLPLFRAPKFEECAFNTKTGLHIIEIALR